LEERRGREVKIIWTSVHAIVNRSCVGRRVGLGGRAEGGVGGWASGAAAAGAAKWAA